MMSNSEARKRLAANEPSADVEALVDGSSQTELRRVVELAIAASPEPPDGFLGEDITLAILASDWLAAHTAAARAEERERIATAIEAAIQDPEPELSGADRYYRNWGLTIATRIARADREAGR